MLNSVINKDFGEIRSDFDDDSAFENALTAKSVYMLSAVKIHGGGKVYVVTVPTSVPGGMAAVKAYAALAMLFFCLYWVLAALWLYKDAAHAKLSPIYWGAYRAVYKYHRPYCLQTLCKHFSSSEPYNVSSTAPFTSERKYSSVTLTDGRTLVLGAPEKLCREIPQEAENLMARGKRVLFAGICKGEVNAENTDLIAMIVIADKLRRNAARTVRYFYRQGVDVKIISGDNPIAAATVA